MLHLLLLTNFYKSETDGRSIISCYFIYLFYFLEPEMQRINEIPECHVLALPHNHQAHCQDHQVKVHLIRGNPIVRVSSTSVRSKLKSQGILNEHLFCILQFPSVRMFAISSKTVQPILTFDSLKLRPGFWEDYKLLLTNVARLKILKTFKKPKNKSKNGKIVKNAEKMKNEHDRNITERNIIEYIIYYILYLGI